MRLSNKIHNTRRSVSSNQITTFLDNYAAKFKKCAKFSKKSSNVNYFYDYLHLAYQKFHKIPKIENMNQELPVNEDLEIYLDNIGSGDLFRTKDEFKSKLVVILKLLSQKYKTVLDDILKIFPFTEMEKDKILQFLNDLTSNKMTEHDIIEWFNFNGQKLARSIYIYILEGKFPEEINNMLAISPEIYGEFTSLDIQKDIELNLLYGKKYEYECGDIILNLKIHSPQNQHGVKHNLLERIFFLHYLHQKSEINLTLWLSSKKKELNYQRLDRYIGPKEINSGCTTFRGSHRSVSVWRKEELEKVLLHELFHSLDLEDKMNTVEIENFIYSHFDIKRDLNKLTVFENYVEVMADILNVFFLVQETYNYTVKKSKKLKSSVPKSKKNLERKKIKLEKKKMFYDILWIEKCWVMFQAAKILNYFRYKTFEEFYRKGGFPEEQKTNKYLQRSNVFSYIILRSMTFFRLNKFLGICQKYNGENPMEYQIPSSDVISFWKDVLNNSAYIKTIDSLLVLLREIETKKNTKPIIFKSMRMTCVEGK